MNRFNWNVGAGRGLSPVNRTAAPVGASQVSCEQKAFAAASRVLSLAGPSPATSATTAGAAYGPMEVVRHGGRIGDARPFIVAQVLCGHCDEVRGFMRRGAAQLDRATGDSLLMVFVDDPRQAGPFGAEALKSLCGMTTAELSALWTEQLKQGGTAEFVVGAAESQAAESHKLSALQLPCVVLSTNPIGSVPEILELKPVWFETHARRNAVLRVISEEFEPLKVVGLAAEWSALDAASVKTRFQGWCRHLRMRLASEVDALPDKQVGTRGKAEGVPRSNRLGLVRAADSGEACSMRRLIELLKVDGPEGVEGLVDRGFLPTPEYDARRDRYWIKCEVDPLLETARREAVRARNKVGIDTRQNK